MITYFQVEDSIELTSTSTCESLLNERVSVTGQHAVGAGTNVYNKVISFALSAQGEMKPTKLIVNLNLIKTH